MKNAQIHRFRDKVALALPGQGRTVYLCPKEARLIARALNAAARDVKARTFTESQFSAVAVDIQNSGRLD